MNNKSDALILSFYFYSFISIVFACISLVMGDNKLLIGSVITLLCMLISTVLSAIFIENNNINNKFVIILSFIMIIPVHLFIGLLGLLFNTIFKLFSYRGGGDDDV